MEVKLKIPDMEWTRSFYMSSEELCNILIKHFELPERGQTLVLRYLKPENISDGFIVLEVFEKK